MLDWKLKNTLLLQIIYKHSYYILVLGCSRTQATIG